MNDIAYVIKKSAPVKILLAFGLCMLAAYLLGSGVKTSVIDTNNGFSARSFGPNGAVVAADLSGTGGKVSRLSLAIRQMSTLGRAGGNAAQTTTNSNVSANDVKTVTNAGDPSKQSIANPPGAKINQSNPVSVSRP